MTRYPCAGIVTISRFYVWLVLYLVYFGNVITLLQGFRLLYGIIITYCSIICRNAEVVIKCCSYVFIIL